MQTLRAGDLSIAPHIHPSCLRLDWQGRSGARDPSAVLVPFFQEACQAAAAQQIAIEMHFEDLEYFNSSTITALIQGIQLAKGAGVRLVLVYRDTVRWQRLSFDALRVFVTGDELEVKPGMKPSPDFGFTIDIPVVGDWENVDMVRLSLQTCVATLFQDVDRRHTLAMVAGELLENAVKYADRPDVVTIFRVRVWGNAVDAYVQVSNPICEENAAIVVETIARIKDADSPASVYCQRMLEIASSPSRMSRLGLLRIAYEGGCTLSAVVDQQILTIKATLPCVS